MSLASERLTRVKERMADACRRAGRPADVRLLAVTKTRPISAIQELYDLGLKAFGENRVVEAEGKLKALPTDIEWHMIGHVQSNKAKACGGFSWVQSLDKVGT